jgi:TRAP-type C4-dicarboxylate transport system permease small subunit
LGGVLSPRILRGWLARADRLLGALEDGLLLVLLAGLVVLASAQIVLRNVFSIGLAWADGSVRLAVLWIAVLGAVAAAREGRHIAIDVLARTLPQTARKVAAVATALFTASVCALLAWHSWRFVEESREFGDVLLDHWPAWPFQLVMPVGFALIGLRYLLRALEPGRGSNAGPGADAGLARDPAPAGTAVGTAAGSGAGAAAGGPRDARDTAAGSTPGSAANAQESGGNAPGFGANAPASGAGGASGTGGNDGAGAGAHSSTGRGD